MKILITGGAGFIGSNLILRLLSTGETVYSLDNYSTGSIFNHHDGCTYVEGDIKDISSIFTTTNETYKFDVIFHLAALARILPSFKDPTKVFESNVLGTQMVLEFSRQIGAKVIYAGSSSKWHNPEQSPYAMSKVLGENLCSMYRSCFKMNVHIARFYNVYGLGELCNGEYATFIGICREKFKNNDTLQIYGDGEQRRDFTHVFDICEALCKIMICEHNNFEWELGTGVNYSINEVASMFGVKSEFVPDRLHNYPHTLRHDDTSLALLGWKPEDRLADYINSCL